MYLVLQEPLRSIALPTQNNRLGPNCVDFRSSSDGVDTLVSSSEGGSKSAHAVHSPLIYAQPARHIPASRSSIASRCKVMVHMRFCLWYSLCVDCQTPCDIQMLPWSCPCIASLCDLFEGLQFQPRESACVHNA